jgi:hypothetical protein
MMGHTCNPGYSGGTGRRIGSSRPAWGKLRRPYLKTKMYLGSWLMSIILAT